MQKNRIIRILPRHATKSIFHFPINFSFIMGFILGVLISVIGFYIIFKWYSIQPENSRESMPVAAKTLDNMLVSAPGDDHLDVASQNPVKKLPETELRRSSADTPRQTKVTETQDTLTKSHNPFTQFSTADRASPLAAQGRAQANNHDLKKNNDPIKTTNTALSKTQVETKAATQVETKAATQVETKAATQVETKAATQVETKAATQVETKAATQVETKAATQVEAKVEASAPIGSSKPTQPSASDMERSKTETQQQIQSEERSTTIQISQPLTNQ